MKLVTLLASIFLCIFSAYAVDIEQSYQDLAGTFSEVEGLIKGTLPVNTQFIVNQVPFTITQPGKYSVGQNLVYSGSGAAITVAADNVSINFRNHSLTVQSPSSVGVLAQNVSEFTLENEVINSASSVGVHLIGVNKAVVNNIFITSNSNAILVENSQDIQLFSSQFISKSGVSVVNSSHVVIDSCTFNGMQTALGLHLEGASTDVIVTNSTFTDCLSSIHALRVDGLLVDGCQAMASSSSNQSLVQLGSGDAGCLANDVIIRNSSFTQATAVAGFNGFLVLAGSGCLLENLVINSASCDLTTGLSSAALHVGYASGSPYENLLAKGCIITGDNPRALFIEHGNKVVVDECHISGASSNNIHMLNATSCTVKNCMIFDGNNGVLLDSRGGGGSNSIKDCFVYNNTLLGISVADMANNNVSGNTVWGCQTGIQIASSDYTETIFNTSCNNSQQNCSNVYPSQAPGGSAALAGSNICCDP